MIPEKLLQAQIPEDCRRALQEDVGAGDVSAGLLPRNLRTAGRVVAKDTGVLCGKGWFEQTLKLLDARARFYWEAEEGSTFKPGALLVQVSATTKALLTGERTALNFLQTLSGTATRARAAREIADRHGIEVMDTRKTIPGLRLAQKYAIWVGGCKNHRLGLWDCVMLKENHLRALGGVRPAVEAARKANGGLPLVVEVENLRQVQEAVELQVPHLLLDNMDDEQIERAAQLCEGGGTNLEVSGNILPERLEALAKLGIRCVSMGSLTKHLQAPDFSMMLDEPSRG